MVDKERLVELAERCEAATGPDTHLDGLITLETGAIGAFTASLDAAMTLVPEGFRLFSLGEARYMTRSPAFCAQLEIWTSEGGIDGSANRSIGVANTLPLALCAAALRARANDGGESQ